MLYLSGFGLIFAALYYMHNGSRTAGLLLGALSGIVLALAINGTHENVGVGSASGSGPARGGGTAIAPQAVPLPHVD